MPRLRKETVDKVIDLIKNGYINTEIRGNTSVSLPTIRKLRKRVESEKIGKDSVKSFETEGLLKKGEESIFLDLEGKKIQFVDVIHEDWFTSELNDSYNGKIKDALKGSNLHGWFGVHWEEIEALKDRVKNLETLVEEIIGELQKKTFLDLIYSKFICSNCRSPQPIAMLITCTKCCEDAWVSFTPAKSKR